MQKRRNHHEQSMPLRRSLEMSNSSVIQIIILAPGEKARTSKGKFV